MFGSKTPKPHNSNWDKLIYFDEANGPCVDLIVDRVKRQYTVPDLVCLVYHSLSPANYISRVIDSSKPCTPDNVGWISKDAALSAASSNKEIKHGTIRPKTIVKWDDLFHVNADGALYLNGEYDGQRQQYLVADYLSVHYLGPWPAQEAYAFIIDMSKPIHAENVAWIAQNPDYRNVHG